VRLLLASSLSNLLSELIRIEGIILLDPPFQPSKTLGLMKLSKYRDFTSRPMMSSAHTVSIDDRASYRSTLLHCLRNSGFLDQEGVPAPLQISRDLYRLVASEWVVVHTYIERDLNSIGWRLEHEKDARLEVLESFLDHLFIFLRRISIYEKLIDELVQSILTSHPVAWLTEQPSIENTKKILAADFSHVQTLFKADSIRINQIFGIIMPLITIRDGKASIAQNRSLGYLTSLATILLPFNAVAAILAIPVPYGPKGEDFWVFWVAAGVVCALVLTTFLVHGAGLNSRENNTTHQSKQAKQKAYDIFGH
jgi:hypothetical protein